MSGTRGICTNFGNCTKAAEKAVMDVAPGAEFKCPECRLSLSPPAGRSGPPRALIVAAAVVLLLGAGVYGVTSMLGGPDVPEDPPIVDAPLEPPPGGDPVPPAKDEPPKRVDDGRPRPPVVPAAQPLPSPVPSVAEKPVTPSPVVAPAPVAAPPPVATAPPAAPPVTAAPVVPAAPAAVLPGRSSIQAQLASEICQEASRVGDPVNMVLASDLNLTNGVVAPSGSVLNGTITSKTSNPGSPTVIQIEAKSLALGSQSMPLVTNPFSFTVPRPSKTGAVVKGAIIGAAAGAAVGVILKQGVGRSLALAGGGAAAGAVIGGAAGGREDACVSAENSRFVFVSTKDAMLQ